MSSTFVDYNDYSGTLRYPLKAPISGGEDFLGDDATGATGATDYLRIQRRRTTYKHGSKNKQYYGANADFITGGGTRQVNSHRTTCYIAIPPGLNAQYQPVYRQVNLGIGGAAAMKAIGSDDTGTLASNIQQAAAAILPEFAASAIAQGSNAISGFFGVQGQLDANVLQGLTTGKVFNPYTEQLFQQMNFRNHSFAIKMLARNAKEAKEINDIIQYIKVGAHPKISGSGDSVLGDFGTFNSELTTDDKVNGVEKTDVQKNSNTKLKNTIKDDINNLSGRFFELPDHYKLDFVRVNPDSVSGSGNAAGEAVRMHYKMTDTVCSGISINYTPDNQYTSFKSFTGDMIQVPAIILNMQFTEVKLLNQSEIRSGF